MDGLAERGPAEKVTEVDGNYASPHYESGSKRPAQPIWRLVALTALRAINFLACVCAFPETTQMQQGGCLGSVFPSWQRMGAEDTPGWRPAWGGGGGGSFCLHPLGPTCFPGPLCCWVPEGPRESGRDSSASPTLLSNCAFWTFSGKPEWLIADTHH